MRQLKLADSAVFALDFDDALNIFEFDVVDRAVIIRLHVAVPDYLFHDAIIFPVNGHIPAGVVIIVVDDIDIDPICLFVC